MQEHGDSTDIFTQIHHRLRLADLKRYTIEELMNELKERGCHIVGIDPKGMLIGVKGSKPSEGECGGVQ